MQSLMAFNFEAWIDEQTAESSTESTGLRAWLAERQPDAPRPSNAAWAWALGHVMQRTFSVDHEGDEVWVLVPGMDLCNHADDPNAQYYAEEVEELGAETSAETGAETGAEPAP